MTSPYGPRPNKPTSGASKIHKGIDIGAKKAGKAGDQIYAAMYGTITKVGYSTGSGYYIYLKNDKYEFRYYHLLKNSTSVKKNQKVKAGQTIAKMGKTGVNVTGVHLHFEVLKNNAHINPCSLFPGYYKSV